MRPNRSFVQALVVLGFVALGMMAAWFLWLGKRPRSRLEEPEKPTPVAEPTPIPTASEGYVYEDPRPQPFRPRLASVAKVSPFAAIVAREDCDRAWRMTEDLVACHGADGVSVMRGKTVVGRVSRRRVLDVAPGLVLAAGGCLDGAATAFCELTSDGKRIDHAWPAGFGAGGATGLVRLDDGRYVANNDKDVIVWREGGASSTESIVEGMRLDDAKQCRERPRGSRCAEWTVARGVTRRLDGLQVDFTYSAGDPAPKKRLVPVDLRVDAKSDRLAWGDATRWRTKGWGPNCEGSDGAICPLAADESRETNDFPTAAWMLLVGCDAGDDVSCVLFAQAAYRGAGTRADRSRALSILEPRCKEARSEACTPLAVILLDAAGAKDIGQRTRARKLLEDGCAGGSADACGHLGELLQDAAPKDPARAATLYRKACDAVGGEDTSYGCYRLALAHLYGRLGIHVDPTGGRKLLERACSPTNWEPLACLELARLQSGEAATGAAKDSIRRACVGGYPPACALLPGTK